ncbi:heat shock factor 2-binding protein-like isoform X1 [Diadema setosum]|uniref:heat shock factor 2-binding protein-like isoform X1 n=2 Tax=Diadema setosum TaxID=31175 RepID=UPI003B3AC074
MDVLQIHGLLNLVKKSFSHVAEEWTSLKHEIESETQGQGHNGSDDNSFVMVKRTAMASLQGQLQILKENLPRIVNEDIHMAFTTKHALEQELDCERKRAAEAQKESLHWKSRHDAARGEYEQERKEKLALKGELSQCNQRMFMQSDYCAGMGAVCCTLLWKASQLEGTISTLLVGSQMQNFMSVVCHTLDSFVATYQVEEIPSEQSEELQFVLALVGTITNVAASAEGREYLATNRICGQMVQTFTSLLSTPSSKSLVKLKDLSLMALYNLSINRKGLGILISTKRLIPLLAWLVQAETSQDIRLHSLLLIQSLILDGSSLSLLHEVRDQLSLDLLESLAVEASSEMKEVIGEVMQIISTLSKHEP